MLQTLTLAELEEFVRGEIRARLDADVSRGSEYDLLARMIAAVAHGNQAAALYALRQAFPSEADGTYLERHATFRGLSRAPAAPARGYTILTSDVGGSLSAGHVLRHVDGTEYTLQTDFAAALPGFAGKTAGPGSSRSRLTVTPNVTGLVAGDVIEVNGEVTAIREVLAPVNAIDLYVPISVDPSGTITPRRGGVVGIIASEDSARGNKDPGEALTLSPADPGGLVDDAAIVAELSGGGDIESNDELRARLLSFLALRPGGGNAADFRQWARGTPGVRLEDAFVYPAIYGLGSVVVVPFGVRDFQFVGTAAREAVAAEIDRRRSFSDSVYVLPWSYEDTATDIVLDIRYGSGYEPDWAGTLTTDAGSTTSVIVVTSSPITAGIEVGDRVAISLDLGSFWQTVQVEVTALSATEITVSPALPVAPPAAATVRPGGPLLEPLLEAVGAVFDALGPGDGGLERTPNPAEEWPATLYRSSLVAAAMAVPGVLDAAVTAPVGDVTPGLLARVRPGTVAISWVAP